MNKGIVDHSNSLQPLLMLMLDVVQSTFKKIMFLWVRQGGYPYHLSSLSCRKYVFLLSSTVKENQRKIHLWSSLWVSVWMLINSVSQWSQHSSQPPSLLVPLLVPAWRIRWHCSLLLLTTLVWPSINGFLNWDKRICSSEHLKQFWTLNRL